MRLLNKFINKSKSTAQKLAAGEDVSLDDILTFVKSNYDEKEQDKFFKDLQLSVYPVVVERLLQLKDSNQITESEFFTALREQTLEMNQLLDKKEIN